MHSKKYTNIRFDHSEAYWLEHPRRFPGTRQAPVVDVEPHYFDQALRYSAVCMWVIGIMSVAIVVFAVFQDVFDV